MFIQENFQMPEWMEKYREYLSDDEFSYEPTTSQKKRTVEENMKFLEDMSMNTAPEKLSALFVQHKVMFLTKLHEEGLLKENE